MSEHVRTVGGLRATGEEADGLAAAVLAWLAAASSGRPAVAARILGRATRPALV